MAKVTINIDPDEARRLLSADQLDEAHNMVGSQQSPFDCDEIDLSTKSVRRNLRDLESREKPLIQIAQEVWCEANGFIEGDLCADALTVDAPTLGATNESLLDTARRWYSDDHEDYVGGMIEMWDGLPVWASYNPNHDKYMAWVCEETWTANDALRYVVEHNNKFRDERHIEVRALVRGVGNAVALIEVLDDGPY